MSSSIVQKDSDVFSKTDDTSVFAYHVFVFNKMNNSLKLAFHEITR